MFVIAGATGQVGSRVAENLLAAGLPVRVLVREAAKGESWRARGAEVAVANLTNAASLAGALRGRTARSCSIRPSTTAMICAPTPSAFARLFYRPPPKRSCPKRSCFRRSARSMARERATF